MSRRMFRSARFRLTITYCLVFFSIFWLFSVGLYYWMERSYGEAYISKVKNQQIEQVNEVPFDSKAEQTVTIAGDVALGQLRKILLVLNGSMIVIIPGLAWLLTERTLRPIERTYKKQKQFVSDASHELRTPLTIMQGELDVALRQTRTPHEYQSALKSTREEVGRLYDLTESLLFVARSDSSSETQFQNQVDIIDTVTEVTSSLEPLAKSQKIKLKFEPPIANLSVNGSPASLKQLFTNLIENAIKFTPNHGSVTVSTEPTDKGILIMVADTGIGMSPQEEQQAFERFYRADSARHKPGFGLGLSICKAIVEQHKGTISLESKKNKGTTIKITLPRS